MTKSSSPVKAMSLSLPVYNLTGRETGLATLDPCIFSLKPNTALLHQVVVGQLANQRMAVANTKDRSEVRGGGRKPWRQKGTGRARAGSIRSPLWRGGGVTFGPTAARQFKQRLNKKMRRQAFLMALSTKFERGALTVVDNLEAVEGRTGQWLTLLKQLPHRDDQALIVSLKPREEAKRALANIPRQKYTSLDGLSLLDLTTYRQLVVEADALGALNRRLGCRTPDHQKSTQDPSKIARKNATQKGRK